MELRSMICDVIGDVAREQKRELAQLEDDSVLADVGLDSLCFAIIVARLEDEFGVDPFTASEEVFFPVTLRELIELYDNAAR